jgi:hypothetical protein
MQRVTAYVDGFNLYFGLKDSSFKRYYWLDVSALAQSLLKPPRVRILVAPIGPEL